MKNKILLALIFIITSCTFMNAQTKFKQEIIFKELKISENYKTSDNVLIQYIGDGSFSNYFYSDITKRLKKSYKNSITKIKFKKKFNKKEPFPESDSSKSLEEFGIIVYMSVSNFKTLSENEGYNRQLVYDLNLDIRNNETKEIEVISTIQIHCLHDINSVNKELIEVIEDMISGRAKEKYVEM
ncbi:MULTISPECIES: hypothetical protein [unclassified Cellulophaga]|uniref:hypothetical protein n=1 Tax=unclassified Cellulophaga TaxID=2634405 RepID=UPI0026E2E3D7|nr:MULTISPECIES: hypothetical protein [unclassified Cellulophaga]MDO6490099.1 hypothetical protein [Cellulophaga sp. 2_MG-2023]MDO6494707.1 hypothetical protein [Cellulophaga sp. 3_MG-2023]